MPSGAPRRRRARPVSDAPTDALLLRTEDLTKGWLLALLEDAPLDEAPAILAADLAREGPGICAAVIRALAADSVLRQLEPGGALAPLVAQVGVVAGADTVAATSRAVQALGEILWSALRAELDFTDADLVSDLAERVGLVIEVVRNAALHGASSPVAHEPVVAQDAPGAPYAPEAPGPPDAEAFPGAAAEAPPTAPPDVSRAPGTEPTATRLKAVAPEPVLPGPLWHSALQDEIVRADLSGAPLSLLLVELEEADRVRAVASPLEATSTFGRFAQAVRGAVRRQDILACESDSRAWIIARDTGRLGAQSLAARIVGAVGGMQPWRGAPMNVSVGLAMYREDGRDGDALIEAAEEARFAASAGGAGFAAGTPHDADAHGHAAGGESDPSAD